jgi:ubiquinone/menaquinone biosynthesis C-methylase UbiE
MPRTSSRNSCGTSWPGRLKPVLASWRICSSAAAGVAERVEVHTADITALPFEDGSFDVVTSALLIHNIPSDKQRYRALDEAMRVLRPGGQLPIADISTMARKYAAHLGQGTLRRRDPGTGTAARGSA